MEKENNTLDTGKCENIDICTLKKYIFVKVSTMLWICSAKHWALYHIVIDINKKWIISN